MGRSLAFLVSRKAYRVGKEETGFVLKSEEGHTIDLKQNVLVVCCHHIMVTT